MDVPIQSEFRFLYIMIGIIFAMLLWVVFSGKAVTVTLPTWSASVSPPPIRPISTYIQKDPITDFYHPPEKQNWWNRILYSRIIPPKSMYDHPINIHTRGIVDEYQQVGILTGNDLSGAPTITPLMGRRSPSGNSKWQYYTIFNGSGSAIPVKLPITLNGKACSENRGCDELQNGDEVAAEGYGSHFKVTIYADKPMYYI
jgi:hypothetical protein